MPKYVYYTIISLIAISTCFFGISKWYNIVEFKEYKEKLSTTIIQQKEINKIENVFQQTKQEKCFYKEKWDFFYIDSICLRKKEYPKLWFKEAIDIIRPFVQSFKNEYQLDKQLFDFVWTSPVIDYSKISLPLYYQNTLVQKKLLNFLESNNIKLKIHKKYFAKYTIDNFSFYPARRDRNKLSDCSFTNYRVWLSAMNWLYIKPHEIFNINKAISYLPWYCKWSGPQDLAFYGGTCWSAWQLFKTALLSPDIDITKRSPHIRWRSPFYWKTIFGDDAAILDYTKQFEIINNWYLPIYFKTLLYEDYDYLVAIYPWKNNKSVKIKKSPTWNLSAEVSKETKNKHWEQLKIQIFPSQYYEYYKGGA